MLKRLQCLLLSNNQIVRIQENLEECLPKLESIILTNNNIQELGDLDVLASVKSLRTLSLLQNPVFHKKHYRLYVIHRLPQLTLLDFQKIKLRERESAEAMFLGSKGQSLVQQIGRRSNTFIPGGSSTPVKAGGHAKMSTSAPNERSRQEAIAAAIASATTLEEVERINRMLQMGQVPGREEIKKNGAEAVVDDKDEDEEMEL